MRDDSKGAAADWLAFGSAGARCVLTGWSPEAFILMGSCHKSIRIASRPIAMAKDQAGISYVHRSLLFSPVIEW